MSFLTTSFLLPLFMLLGSIIIDIQNYSTRTASLQNTVDDAVLAGTKYLPDEVRAKEIALSLMHSKASKARSIVAVKDGSLIIDTVDEFFPFLSDFFNGTQGDGSFYFSLPITASASGKITPVDLFLAMERGNRIAPSLTSNGSDRFGGKGDYPVPSYFESKEHSINNHLVEPVIALEQCFNPVFSKMKALSIRVLDSIAGSPQHRLSVNFFPGSGKIWGNNRRLTPFRPSIPASFYDSHLEWDIDHQVVTFETEPQNRFPIQSVECAQIAQDKEQNEAYRFPEPPLFIKPVSVPLINSGFGEINPEYPLTYREPIWSRVANSDDYFDTNAALLAMQQELFSTPAFSARAGLSNRTKQVGFFVTKSLPQVQGVTLVAQNDPVWNALEETLKSIRNIKKSMANRLTIFYLMLEASESDRSLVQTLFDAQREVSADGAILFSGKVLSGGNVPELMDRVIPALLRGEQSSVLSK